MDEVLEFLRKVRTFYLATIDGCRPRVRPFGAVTAFGGKIYLVTENGKKVFKQIMDNPKIEICGMTPEFEWIRVEAEAVLDDNREVRAKMLEDNPELKDMYTPDDGNMVVLYLKDAKATFESYTEKPRTVEF
ncbi:MAG: pyridoxamine 5'-phosphate oxidase family protein [Bacillota bacterium]|nr:pyridoxamine 5'-phosphate oxidase family protein [Bacillota bacterium]